MCLIMFTVGIIIGATVMYVIYDDAQSEAAKRKLTYKKPKPKRNKIEDS